MSVYYLKGLTTWPPMNCTFKANEMTLTWRQGNSTERTVQADIQRIDENLNPIIVRTGNGEMNFTGLQPGVWYQLQLYFQSSVLEGISEHTRFIRTPDEGVSSWFCFFLGTLNVCLKIRY